MKLKRLPESIGNLESLENLSLEGNLITSLPESLMDLSNLKSIYIGTNPLDKKSEEILKDLEKKGVLIEE